MSKCSSLHLLWISRIQNALMLSRCQDKNRNVFCVLVLVWSDMIACKVVAIAVLNFNIVNCFRQSRMVFFFME